MSLIPYYLQYLSEICEGTRQAPEGHCADASRTI